MSWRSKDGKYRLIDGEIYMAANEGGRPIFVHLTYSMTALEQLLVRLLMEATSEKR